ncbi:poly [ADP-ribose] polymerase 12 isoform X1 [Notothenia coriiceps]|uniref:Poly [ADP-ribose] polymerase 12 isoform X1 n=1 Tax=Notothenia coriiceps TaxID=8208 RepID=A0A6I9Q5T8_9TELE|nr:PREDICTED: poly [ADP-ribose] polymerase 12-like isoform X1 [Notothenia coriiceps]
MASAYLADEEKPSSDPESSSEAESDASEESDSDSDSDEGDGFQLDGNGPCKYYNKGRCRDGERCSFQHVCQFALTGSCRYGSKCKLNHPTGGGEPSGASNRDSGRSTSSGEEDAKLTDGRCYQWQLNAENGWMDVDNDHILEAQYSLPHCKGIKIYNTLYGAVSIDFNRMRVDGKSLRARRLDDGNTVWIWYCTLGRKWIKYGDKDSKGHPSPVKSSDIENKFQSNPTSSFTLNVGAKTSEIKFSEMRQVSKKKKRKVTRRPLFRQQPAGAQASQAPLAFQNLSVGSKPQWQFEGNSGAWHVFKHRQRGTSTECSVISDEIERKYQQNPQSSMTFDVKGQTYKMDFAAMIQTNLNTKHSRRIRRVLV